MNTLFNSVFWSLAAYCYCLVSQLRLGDIDVSYRRTPLWHKLRLVGEINGESVRSKSANNSPLVGFIWEAPLQNVFINPGIRWGISSAAADGMFTTGLTFSFSLATISRK